MFYLTFLCFIVFITYIIFGFSRSYFYYKATTYPSCFTILLFNLESNVYLLEEHYFFLSITIDIKKANRSIFK